MRNTKEKEFLAQVIKKAEASHSKKNEAKVAACLVVDGEIISEGVFDPCVGDHAEVVAINNVKNKSVLKKATLFVNLEPCSVYKRTPSCVDLIKKYNIPKVVVGCKDAFSQVNGFGIELLKKAGVEVVLGNSKEAKAVNNDFFKHISQKKSNAPYIKISSAVSIDGKLTDISKNQTKISTQRDTYAKDMLRSEHDAVMVGGNTWEQDEPSLIIRNKKLQKESYRKRGYPYPMKIVVTEKIPRTINMFSDFFAKEEVKKIVFTTSKTSKKTIQKIENASHLNEVFVLGKDKVDLGEAMKILTKFGIDTLLVEGGGELNYQLFRAGLVDELELHVRNIILGGTGNPSVVTGKGFERSNAPEMILDSARKIDTKTCILNYRRKA